MFSVFTLQLAGIAVRLQAVRGTMGTSRLAGVKDGQAKKATINPPSIPPCLPCLPCSQRDFSRGQVLKLYARLDPCSLISAGGISPQLQGTMRAGIHQGTCRRSFLPQGRASPVLSEGNKVGAYQYSLNETVPLAPWSLLNPDAVGQGVMHPARSHMLMTRISCGNDKNHMQRDRSLAAS